ncbi:hypothetical protein [Paraglaciecola aestuariivivens]
MKNIDIGQTISILANIGVIVGIVFLIFELQQNTQTMRLASAQSYLTGGASLDFQIATNPEFANLLIRGDNKEDLSDGEALQLDRWNYAVFRQWETAHYLHIIDALEDKLWLAYRHEIHKILSRSLGMRLYWIEGKNSFTPAFQQEINKVLDNTLMELD